MPVNSDINQLHSDLTARSIFGHTQTELQRLIAESHTLGLLGDYQYYQGLYKQMTGKPMPKKDLPKIKMVKCYNGLEYPETCCIKITHGRYAGEMMNTYDKVSPHPYGVGSAVPRECCWRCEGFGRWYVEGEGGMTQIDGMMFSSEWVASNCVMCETCGALTFTSNVRNRAGSLICTTCDFAHPPRLMEYNNRIAGRFMPEDNTGLTFGIEVECESRDEYDSMGAIIGILEILPSRYAILKRDGSLNEDRGIEIVTRPDSIEVHTREWTRLLEGTLPALVRSWHGENCGMHVHVGRDMLTQLQIDKMSIFMNSPENYELIVSIAGRNETRWSQFREKHWGHTMSVDKYEMLNTLPENTVEFRIFRGNLALCGFLKNLEFCHALTTYCMPAECSAREVTTPGGFLGFVVKNRYRYPNLCEFLKSRKWVDFKCKQQEAPNYVESNTVQDYGQLYALSPSPSRRVMASYHDPTTQAGFLGELDIAAAPLAFAHFTEEN